MWKSSLFYSNCIVTGCCSVYVYLFILISKRRKTKRIKHVPTSAIFLINIIRSLAQQHQVIIDS